MNLVKLIITVPETHAEVVRQAMGEAGAGTVGNYHHCSFSVKGTGRFIPAEGARPAIGEVGKLEEVIEERIEVSVEKEKLQHVIAAVKKVHPYEEPSIDVYSLLSSE